jgi:hypothetical protein
VVWASYGGLLMKSLRPVKKMDQTPEFGGFCNPVFPKDNVIANVFYISKKKSQVFQKENISSFVM